MTKSNSPVFGFSHDGSMLYVVRRTAAHWELATIDVRTASERKVSSLGIPAGSDLLGFSLKPDGRSFATSVSTSKSDIWLMQGLPPAQN